ncbi:MAG: radical SAM protein [Candidatus Eisenbacteria bacterium]|jgi:SynChlorMet cassette radical SAM/SPASM protein ScmF|nr:radical SAM protein [Candidatus Eisenbacteria bacterium]
MSCLTEKQEPVAPTDPAAPLDLPPGVPPLTSLYLYVSGGCNLACQHCWITPSFDPSGASAQHVKLEHVAKAIREGFPIGLRTIKLTGGEPMLHPRFRELVQMIAEARIGMSMETNGTLIDRDLARFLKEHRFAQISISVDGPTAEVHDSLRGVPGAYARAIAGIGHLVEEGMHPQMICTLHDGNVAHVDAVIEQAERLGCNSVKFNHVQVVGRGDLFAKKHGLTVEGLLEVYRHIDKQVRPTSKIPVYLDIPVAFHSIRQLSKAPGGRCGILTILGMLSGGDLALCGIGVNVPELVYGHIETDNLRDVWCFSPGLIELRDLIPAKFDGICGNCVLRDTCLGSCVANNFYVAGRLNASYIFCDTANTLGLFPASRMRVGSLA